MKKYIFTLCILVLLLSGCVHQMPGRIDMAALSNPKVRYGVLLLRTQYFGNADPETVCGKELKRDDGTWANGGQILIGIRPEVYGGAYRGTPESEFDRNYIVSMLPEGRYYFSRIFAYEYGVDYKETDKTSYFDVKAGEVTYIGDYYIANPKFVKGHLFRKSEYVVRRIICDRFDEAKKFFREKYPHVNLPIKKNIMRCCEAYVKSSE